MSEDNNIDPYAKQQSPFDERSDDIELPNELPILPLRGIVAFPMGMIPLGVGRAASLAVVNHAMNTDRLIGLVAQKEKDVNNPGYNDIYRFGTAAVILKVIKLPDETFNILVQGLTRFKIDKFIASTPFIKAEVSKAVDDFKENIRLEALVKNLRNQFMKLGSLTPNFPEELKVMTLNIEDPAKLADFIISSLDIPVEKKQTILECVDVQKRIRMVTESLAKQINLLEVTSKIQQEIQEGISKSQRDYYLRQQLEALKRELGEERQANPDIADFQKRLAEVKLSEEALKQAQNELKRMADMSPASAEYGVIRTYLDWMTSLPWEQFTTDNIDIVKARKILNDDHFGLEQPKERILEFLAVRKYKQDVKSPILCFVGPPGVGKTSLGRSIARALGRKFFRISLGGVRDEAEIRGHRRTYIGALPGQIIHGIRRCESSNPLFMLDEIDKLGNDFRGDPASALLEALDPEQNNTFQDHYLDVRYDLSNVLFIATANVLDTIPRALLDRMEVIRLPGYTEDEKLSIAKKYLIPKQTDENGLESLKITFEDDAIRKLIRDYTREAGLRNLEREIGNTLRKIAKGIAENKRLRKKVTPVMVRKLLGPEKFAEEAISRLKTPGVALGLAWTSVGGDILFIETTSMYGAKGLTLTGKLGEVMRESAQTALSYVRANVKKYDIPEDFFNKRDIHIHFPEGATPKDGPSAGVTITTALVSLLTGRCCRSDTAMTGEISLRGKVLPVGGIKEKVLAVQRFGLKRVILPKFNKRDLEEIPERIKNNLEFIFVDRVDQVIKNALIDPDTQAKKANIKRKTRKKKAK